MSLQTPTCESCGGPARHAGLVRMSIPEVYGVAWECPRCATRSLSVSPIGPLLPREGVCPQCGHDASADVCESCGTRASEVEAWTRETDDIVAGCGALAGRGLVQRACVIANRTLALDPDLPALWTFRSHVLTAIGGAELALSMVDAALGLELADGTRAALLCEASHLHAEVLDAEPALSRARAALAILPDDPWAVYLEGRALALSGDLTGARASMQRALTLHPAYDDAHRALRMIEEALGSG